MKAIVKHLAIVILLFGMHSFVLSQIDEAAVEDTGVIRKAVFEFPDVEGWTKGEVHIYDDPGLGYGVNYDSKEGGRVTVYLYDRGNDSILPGFENDAVISEIEIAKREIDEFVRKGVYQKADISQWDYVTIGGAEGKVQANRVILRLWKNESEYVSEIYLFAANNKFVKVRATREKSLYGRSNIAFDRLMAALDKVFSD